MTKKVIVAIHEYRNGQTVRVFDTPAKAQEWKDEIGADNWGVVSKDPQPEDPCGDEYFELSEDEWFTVEECDVE